MQYDGFKPLSGDALFVQTDKHRARIQRKHLNPAFQPRVIEAQYDSLSKHLKVSLPQCHGYKTTLLQHLSIYKKVQLLIT